MVGGGMLPLSCCGRSHWPITTVAFWMPAGHMHFPPSQSLTTFTSNQSYQDAMNLSLSQL